MAQLPLQNFIQNQTVVNANWLNQVDLVSHVLAGDATGHLTLAAPTAAGPALTINGAAGSTTGALNIIGGNGPFASQTVAITGGTNANNIALFARSQSSGEAILAVGNSATGQSLGLTVIAGTNSSDVNSAWFNVTPSGTGEIQLMALLGDGGLVVGPVGTVNPGPGAINASALIKSAASVAPPAGGSATCGFLVSSVTNLGFFFGTGAPTFSAAEGSLYSNTTGGAGARLYVNTSSGAGTSWTALTTP